MPCTCSRCSVWGDGCNKSVWRSWNTTSTNSVTDTTDNIWRYWVGSDQTTSSATSVTDNIWYAWNQDLKYQIRVANRIQEVARQSRLVSPEEVRRQERERKERQRRREEERKKARGRAKKILVEHLTEAQRQSFEKEGFFLTEVMVGGKLRRFRIEGDRYMHNVFEIDAQGRKIREYCAHTAHACPQEDHMLAQKFMLECAPEEFFKVANIWDLTGTDNRSKPLISPSGRPLVLN